jgi:acetylornithine deacetylase/succinyl-diaminopimelate desuccinylase-like protein
MKPVPAIDWDALTEEAVTLLSDYLRIDTINPPGHETLACEWLGAILDAEGIPYRTYALDPERASLVATLPGDRSRGRSLLLLNHTDVVPAEPQYWTDEPLSGAVHDGYVWGRGAMDMKGMAVIELMVFILHRRLGLPLHRDLTFMAVADEENGSEFGSEFLSRDHEELFDCDFVINEGGTGAQEVFGVRRPVFHVGVAEKGPLWLRLFTTGTPGHGSVPHDDNALERLTRAVERVRQWDRPLQPTPEVQAYFDALYHAGILPYPPTGEQIKALASQHPRVHSLQTNSISLTSMHAGMKHNVIPAQAEATIDVRLVAGYDPARFMEELRAVIDDPRVEIETVFESSTPASSTETELFRAIQKAVRELVEDAVVVPSVSTGFTDLRVFRRRGIPSYGFVPVLLEPEDAGRTHGNDERLAVDSIRLALQILFHTVREVCE